MVQNEDIQFSYVHSCGMFAQIKIITSRVENLNPSRMTGFISGRLFHGSRVYGILYVSGYSFTLIIIVTCFSETVSYDYELHVASVEDYCSEIYLYHFVVFYHIYIYHFAIRELSNAYSVLDNSDVNIFS